MNTYRVHASVTPFGVKENVKITLPDEGEKPGIDAIKQFHGESAGVVAYNGIAVFAPIRFDKFLPDKISIDNYKETIEKIYSKIKTARPNELGSFVVTLIPFVKPD